MQPSRVVLGIEVEHDLLSLQLLQRDLAAAVGRQGETRRLVANFQADVLPSQAAFGHSDVRDGVFVEGLALGGVAVALIEFLRADAGIEDDHAIAVAPRPSFGVSKQPRPDALALLAVGHVHLLELERVRAEGLKGDGGDHGPVYDGAEMPPAEIVGQFLLAQGEPERFAQDCLAELQALSVELRAVRRLGQPYVVRLGHAAPSPAPTVNRPRVSRPPPVGG